MIKTHFDFGTEQVRIACGRPAKRATKATTQVDCRSCKTYPVFTLAADAAKIAADAAFEAQVPRKYDAQFGGPVVCSCGSDLFRYKGRSCMGHYDDYECSSCRKVTSRMTETGMCF